MLAHHAFAASPAILVNIRPLRPFWLGTRDAEGERGIHSLADRRALLATAFRFGTDWTRQIPRQ